MSSFTKKSLSLLLVSIMLFSLFSPVSAFAEEIQKRPLSTTRRNGVTVEEMDDSYLYLDLMEGRKYSGKDDEPKYADDEVVRVSIVLDGASTIAAGFSSVRIAENRKAMDYRAELLDTQKKLADTISKKALGGKELDVVWNLTLAANIISANVEYGKIKAIEGVKGVKKVVLENRYEPMKTDSADKPNMGVSTEMTGATLAWASGYTGAGGRVAIIDTGTEYLHQSFDPGAFEYALKQNAEEKGMSYSEYVASLDLLDEAEIASVWSQLHASKFLSSYSGVYYNKKVAFGVNYIDRNKNITHDHDGSGDHGSHVSGIAASNRFIPDGDGYVNAIEAVKTQGEAPDAQILTMKVFGANGGAYDSDYMCAIEDAIILGADSVNLSLGSSVAGLSYSEEYEDVMDSITESGTTVVMSAGNNSYWAEQTYFSEAFGGSGYLYSDSNNFHTGGSPGSFTNSFTVASVDNDGSIGHYFKVNGKDDVYTYAESTDYRNKPLATLAGEHEFVMITPGTAGNEAEVFGALASVLDGKVAICWRGNSSFFEKANAAIGNGAIATVIANNTSGVIYMNLTGYSYTAPAVTIVQSDGLRIMAGAEEHELDGVTYYTGKFVVAEAGEIGADIYGSANVTMSSFSSWGNPGNLELTPEISAPGGNIWSILGDTNYDGYQIMSGTSMAAPQITGLVAVLNQYVRENDLCAKTGLTERQLALSLLMGTAQPIKSGDSGYFYPVIQQGAGLGRVDLAVSAHSYILMNEDATESYADGKVKAELGEDAERTGVYTFSFTINNMTDEDREYKLSADLFTQDLFSVEGFDFRDTWAVPLNFTAEWKIDGEKLDPAEDEGVLNCDFDGDGDVDLDDGQALLDYLVQNRDSIYNSEYADLDEDGDIDSYDAYLFYLGFSVGTVTVEGNDSIEVEVTLTALNIDDYDDNGAYVEGYVWAKEMVGSDGAEGDVLSIPVLAYYGDWSEPPMFDIGTYASLVSGTEERPPYLYAVNDVYGNAITLNYAGVKGEYVFGGNPVIADETWMPERDAIDGAHDKIKKVYFSLIRNADATRFTVVGDDGKTYYENELGQIYAAHYNPNSGAWEDTQYSFDPGFNLKNVPEGTRLTFTLQGAMENDVEGGNVDWDSLPETTKLVFEATIDNTDPVLTDVDITDGLLAFTASDNQYIAGILLYDDQGNLLASFGSDPDAEPGESKDYDLDVPGGLTKFLLVAVDYANNEATYKINLNPAELDEPIEVNVVEEEAQLFVGGTVGLHVEVTPWGTPDESVTWSSSDESIATVDDMGIVTGLKKGVAVITATSNADPTKSDSCEVNVTTVPYTLYGELQDVEGNPQTFVWDLENEETWTKVADTASPLAATTISHASPEDTQYFLDMNSSTYAFSLKDFFSGETVATYANSWDVDDFTSAYLFMVDAGSENDYIVSTYGSWVLAPADVTGGVLPQGYNLASYGVGYLAAICENGVGYDEEEEAYYDEFLAIDTDGNFWFFDMFLDGNMKFGSLPTTLEGLEFPGYGGLKYCSLVMANDGAIFFSYFDGDTNVIYYLEIDVENEVVNAKECGNVGADVWPAGLIAAISNDAAGTGNGGNAYRPIDVVKAGFLTADDIQAVEPREREAAYGRTNESTGSGTVDSGITVRTADEDATDSIAEVSEDGETVTVTLIAHDSEGGNADVTNGITDVTYDPERLELVSAEVKTQYYSINDKEEGEVKFDYVHLDGVKEGETVAVLVFKVKNDEKNTKIVIDWTEVNDEDPVTDPENPDTEPEEGFEEVLVVDFGNPDTGDTSGLIGWIVIASVAAAGLILVLVLRKRRSNG